MKSSRNQNEFNLENFIVKKHDEDIIIGKG